MEIKIELKDPQYCNGYKFRILASLIGYRYYKCVLGYSNYCCATSLCLDYSNGETITKRPKECMEEKNNIIITVNK